jgi:hypothetical protein
MFVAQTFGDELIQRRKYSVPELWSLMTLELPAADQQQAWELELPVAVQQQACHNLHLRHRGNRYR